MTELIFNTSIPDKDGWYLVKLKNGHYRPTDPGYHIAFYTTGGKYAEPWSSCYGHNVDGWIKLPEEGKK